MGATTVRLAGGGVTFQAVALPVLRSVDAAGDAVTFRQTAGGRTGVPPPRPVPHPPFVRWQSPTVWTTLSLTIHADGTTRSRMTGASAFTRHWLYGADCRVTSTSAFTDESRSMAHSFAGRTPWGDQDLEALVAEVETEVARRLSEEITRGGVRLGIRRRRAAPS